MSCSTQLIKRFADKDLRRMKFKDYHIIIIPKDKERTKTFKVSGVTLKVLAFTLALSIPLFFVSVLSAIHFQNKLIALKQSNYENRKLMEQRDSLIVKLAKLEKTISTMDDSISHLSELMDIDPQSLKFGTGPVADIESLGFEDELDENVFSLPQADEVVDEWISDNGKLTVNKFNQKFGRLQDEATILNRKLEEIFSQNKDKINYVNAMPNMMPVEGWVTSEFGVRNHPIAKRFKMHNGVDIASPIGTPIKAPAGGKVVFAGRSGGYGNTVVLQHGYGISTLYGHLSQINVKQGETVKRGDVVGELGTSGYSTGPHLHYEVSVDGIPDDPLAFIVN